MCRPSQHGGRNWRRIQSELDWRHGEWQRWLQEAGGATEGPQAAQGAMAPAVPMVSLQLWCECFAFAFCEE
jgi:hypothetical protein